MAIFFKKAVDYETEYLWLSNFLKNNLNSDSNFAVIARTNKELLDFLLYLNFYKLEYEFAKEKSVFDIPLVNDLLNTLELIDSISNHYNDIRDDLLLKFLSQSHLNLPDIDIWLLSQIAYSQKKSWLTLMLNSDNLSYENIKITDPKKLILLAKVLLHLGKLSKNLLALEIIDICLGNKEISFKIDNKDFFYKSNFLDYYFNSKADYGKEKSEIQLSIEKQEYLIAIKTLFHTLKNNLKTAKTDLSGLIKQLQIIKKNNLAITYSLSENKEKSKIKLLTAHRAKGLEFETVIILNSNHENWFKNGTNKKINFSPNLTVYADSENDNDRLRLFYVAITRTRQDLYFLTTETDDKNKLAQPVVYLPEKWEKISVSKKTIEEYNSLLSKKDFKITKEQTSFLKNILQNYQLSVTHLINFIDIINAGPQKFLEVNLLKFPKMKDSLSCYGTSMHNVLKNFVMKYKIDGKISSLDWIKNNFFEELEKQIINKQDFLKYYNKGIDNLTKFYPIFVTQINSNDFVEFNFKGQNVWLDESYLTGQIDRIVVDEKNKEMIVIDYKSSKSLSIKEIKNKQNELRYFKYQIQIIFYKILIENSRDFGGKYKVNKGFIQFLEADKNDQFSFLEIPIDKSLYNTIITLIPIVYNKIQNLDFSINIDYEDNLKGILQFINYLIGLNIVRN